MEAAKKRTVYLIWLASALLVCAPALASSLPVSHPKTRAEVSPENRQFSIEPLAASPETASSYYDWLGEVASESSVAPKAVGSRQLRLPQTNPRLAGTNTLGETLPNGQVFLQPGLSRAQQAATLRHESVHAYLSVADDAPLATLRQNVGVGAYHNSAFFNATEEILAQTYATGSLRQGIGHAFNGQYRLLNGTVVTPARYAVEVGVGATGLGALGYGAYQLGSWFWGDE